LEVTGIRNGQWCRYIHGHNVRTRECATKARANMSVAAKGIIDHPSRFKPGPDNPAYKHGETAEHEANRSNWWQRAILREPILERDGHQCTLCASTENLCVHHIDGDVTNNDPANLQTVCATCHWKLTHG
jgi:hypothetical protein